MFPQKAVIARTNLGLFEEMARVLRGPEGNRKRLGFVGVSNDKCVCVCVCVGVCVSVCVCVCVKGVCLCVGCGERVLFQASWQQFDWTSVCVCVSKVIEYECQTEVSLEF